MKKVNFMVLILLYLFVSSILSACSCKVASSDPLNPTEQCESTDESTEQDVKNDDSEVGTPHVIITFDSMDNIVEFVTAANSQEKQFSEYAAKHNISEKVTYDVAKDFASSYNETALICPQSDVVYESFSGTYYAERNELSTIYRIDNTIYRFVYTFNSNAPHQYEGEPILHNVRLGPFELNLYQGEGCLVGSVVNGATIIRVIVKSEQLSEINFDNFQLASVPNNYQTERAQ